MAVHALDVLLLAAGFGLRLRPLTQQIPKALLPILGAPLLDLHLARLLGSPDSPSETPPARHVVVNAHHLANQIRTHVAAHPQAARIGISCEREILGTGGAIAQAAEQLTTDPFLVLNADALGATPIAEAVAFHQAWGWTITMVLAPSPIWPNVCVDHDRVTGILRGERNAQAFTFTGLQVIARELVDRLPRGTFHDIRDTYDALIAEKRLGAFVWQSDPAAFLDVGTPEDYLEAQRRCAAGCDLPRRGGDPIIPAEGYGFSDAHAHLGAGCRIEESVVLAGAQVEAGARLRRVIVGPGARVGGSVRNLMVTTLGTCEIRETATRS